MIKLLRLSGHAIVFLALTILTQLGGLVYLLTICVAKKYRLARWKTLALFLIGYCFSSFLILPQFSHLLGREPLPWTGELRPLNVTTCLLNRHYVTPELKDQMLRVSAQMQQEFPGSHLQYLDACFPLVDGFPLLPHLSHNDGRKIDLAFYYADINTNKSLDDAPSPIGYGVHEDPKGDEPNTTESCLEGGHWQYGFVDYLVPDWSKDKYKVNKFQTRRLIQLLSEDEATDKLFLEPHLKYRWNLAKYTNIKFHGCHAVRHDDHIHTQVIRPKE
ncbi:MAG: hypothetical protein P8L71_02165 [Flavobacteriales bacterium]|nr:hypothetical protein [Flavobacteriales bacterium]